MPIITLTTDFGIKDHCAGALKGAILKELNDANIVDISHAITPFNIAEAAYVLKNAYKSFPDGSIHIIGVDAELTPEVFHLAIELDNHFFLCADNGVISLLANEIQPKKIVKINIPQGINKTYSELQVFVRVACHIARGGVLEVIGKPVSEFVKCTDLMPKISDEQNEIRGNVMYIDNYGNAVSNISKSLFNSVGRGRPFEVFANTYVFPKILDRYSDIVNFNIPKEERNVEGTRMAIFNASNFLEIALYKANPNVGSAASLLGLTYRKPIIIKFK
jgi:S-adenosylmethionine hydrolase